MGRSFASRVSHPRLKWVILVFWLVVAARRGAAGRWADRRSRTTTSRRGCRATPSPPGRSSGRPRSAPTPTSFPAVIVYERPAGLTAADLDAVAAGRRGLRASSTGSTARSSGRSRPRTGRRSSSIVPLNLGPDGWEAIGAVVDDIRRTASDGPTGSTSTSPARPGNAADSSEAFEGIDSTLLLRRARASSSSSCCSPTAARCCGSCRSSRPVVALICAQAVIYLLAEYADLTVNAQSAGILTVLVFGAGTDYALLLVARYREELRLHDDRHEAMAVALHRAGPADASPAAARSSSACCACSSRT